MGILKKRCFSSEYGIIQLDEYITDEPYCHNNNDCPTQFICGKMLSNPEDDTISFDTFGWAFLQVFITTTLEGWTDIMIAV